MENYLSKVKIQSDISNMLKLILTDYAKTLEVVLG